MIAAIGAWFAARKLALVLYGVLAAAAVAAVFGLIEHGKSIAEAKCDSAAKDAIIEAQQADLNLAAIRAKSQDDAIAGLLRRRLEDDAAISVLQKEVDDAKLQSTAPGAKIDANALLDDKCNYTARGARRVREQDARP